MESITWGLLVFVLAYVAVGVLRRWVVRHGVIDVPNERSSHSRPTPRGGGLGIVLITLAGMVVTWMISPACPFSILLSYVAAGGAIAAVSWLDDLRSLPYCSRLVVHGLVALMAIAGLGYWRNVSIPMLGLAQLGWLGALAAFIWIVGMINAYNFMDGIDGIASGQAVVAGVGWVLLGRLSGQDSVTNLGILIGAASLGFLGHNWPPARIFMGDVGSAFLGFTFAALPLIATPGGSRMPLAGLLLVWPFVFDAAFTFLRRLRHGENVFAAHRSHLYQRLVVAGRSHLFVTMLYAGLAVAGLFMALAWFVDVASGLFVIVLPLLCLGLWTFVTREERKHAAARVASSVRTGPLQP